MQKTQHERKRTPVKVITPDELCRVCRCSPAILGRGKFNLFSAQSKALKLADRLQTVLGQPVQKVSGVSSTLCYKCKRELEKYEKYIQVLEVELKKFRELYRQSVEQFEIRCIEVKRCQNLTPSPMAYHRGQNSKLRFDIVLSVFFPTLRLDIQVFIHYESFSYLILSFLHVNFEVSSVKHCTSRNSTCNLFLFDIQP